MAKQMFTEQQVREEIVKFVREKYHATSGEIVAAVGPECLEHNLADLLERMVDDGDLVETEFVLPDMHYRIKSIYFPKGTSVQVRVK